MSVMLDLIGSVVIAGFVILMGLRLNETISGSADASMAGLNVQESMSDIVSDLESDFRKIGYNIPDPRTSIAIADTAHIKFYADLYHQSRIDSVEWFTGPVLTTLPNPNIRVLFRKYNADDALGAAGLGVTQFYLRYFNSTGDTIHPWETTRYSEIWTVEISLRVESPYKVQDAVNPDNSQFAAAYWRQTRLSSRNLSRHGN
jgi:hypothetical protein